MKKKPKKPLENPFGRDRFGIGDAIVDVKALGGDGTVRELAFVLGVQEERIRLWVTGRAKPAKRNECALVAIKRLRQVLPNREESARGK